jgi:excisionase family DNA binding protein
MKLDSELLAVSDFADALGVTDACVRKWLLERRINSTRIGKLVRIPKSEIERLVEQGLRPAREVKRGESR